MRNNATGVPDFRRRRALHAPIDARHRLTRVASELLLCPTTIFTAGLLLLAAPHSRTLAIVPIVWSVIGGFAAFLLGVTADYALPVAGAVLAVFELLKSQTSSTNEVPPLQRPVMR